MSRVEQVARRTHWRRRHHASAYRRWLKRFLHRLMRRAAKLDPENAPTKTRDMLRGWED